MPSLSLLDRLIAKIAPAAAIKRLAARQAFEAFSGPAPGGSGAPQSPSNARWMVTRGSADADTLRALPQQRFESRDLRRTNPIAAGAIKTNLDRVVGTGLVPIPEPDLTILGWTEEQAAEWKSTWLREFSMWADSKECTLDRSQTFFERQELVLGSRLESGDCFTVLPDAAPTPTMPYRLRLQTIEAERVGNPGNGSDKTGQVAGIRLDPVTGAPQAAHVYNQHPGTALQGGGDKYAGQWVEFYGASGRRRVLHHYRPTRPEQTRGVPYLAPVIQAIKDLGRYTEAEITAAVLSAFYTVFIESGAAGGSPAPVFGADAPGAQSSPDRPDEGASIAMGPGAVIGLAGGEKATFADPKRPNTAYEPFVTGILKFVGMALGLPVELLTKAFSASYSASKAALLDAWQHFRTERAWLVNSFCQPVYETLMAEAVASGRIAAPGFFEDPLVRWAYTRANWHGDSQGSINPKDEVAAYRDAIDGKLMTHERATWELFGTDWGRTYPTMRRERDTMTADGMLPAPRAGAAAAPATPPSTAPAPA
jgi:lambda family phage portal protein